jgi:subtilisin family serine protease
MYNYPLHRPTVLATALLLGLSSTIQAEYPSSVSLTEGQAVAGQFIVKLKSGLQSDGVNSLQQEMQAVFVQDFPLIGAELWQVNGISSDAVAQQYQNDPRIEYIEPNYLLSTLAVPNDPDFAKLWGLHNTGQTGGKNDADIDAPEAWDITTGGDVTIAVIDTGVDYNHPDIAASMWKNPKEIPGNGRDDDGNGFVDDVYGYDFANNDGDPMDDHYHGTHCAGTIAGVGNNGTGVAGVNWKAKIMALKFLDSNGGGATSNAILALQYAVKMGAKISSNSWGCVGCKSQALYDAIKAADAQGHLFIAAAGNHGGDNDGTKVSYPSSYDLENIIAVAATDSSDNLASFSGYGKTTVDLGAPGVNIYSTKPGNAYTTLSGTSMATPHVAGVAGLLKAYKPDFSHLLIKERLLKTVDPIPALTGKAVTGGRLNAYNAVNFSGNTPPPGDSGIKARLQAAVKGFCVILDGSTSTPSQGGQIINYVWAIVKKNSNVANPGSQIALCVPDSGTYTVVLTVVDDKGASNTTFIDVVFRLPRLGDRAVAVRSGRSIYTTARIDAGIKVFKEGSSSESLASDTLDQPPLESVYSDQATVNPTEEVDIRGELLVESAHVGQVADIVVFVEAQFPTSTGTLLYMLDSNGVPQLWNGQPDTLVAFKPHILLSAIHPVEMYRNSFGFLGTLRIYLGYRLQEGTVIQNSKPINVEILP